MQRVSSDALRERPSWFSSPGTRARPTRHVEGAEAAARVAGIPGALPVEVIPGPPARVVWLDFGDRPLVEQKFRFSVDARLDQAPGAACFSTPLDPAVLAATGEPLPIAGFVFLLPRSGTTLLAKALARCPENAVLNEATALQEGVIEALCDGWRSPIEPGAGAACLRALIGALARRRAPGERRAFFKFMTFHSLYLDVLRAAFPQVPFLFVYREPVEVLVSAAQRPGALLMRVKGGPAAAAWTGLDARTTAEMDDDAYRARLFRRYLEAVATHGSPISVLDYRDISPDRLPSILARAFGYQPDPDALAAMRDQFRFYSKADGAAVPFAPDGGAKRQQATPRLLELARDLDPLAAALDRSPANVGRVPVGSAT